MRVDRTVGDFFTRGERVGSGTYGCVYVGTRKGDPSRVVAIKEPRTTESPDDRRLPPAIFRELAFLSEIDYPHIVRLPMSNIFLDHANCTVSMVYDYGAVDVRKVVHLSSSSRKPASLKPVIAKSILFQLLLALDHLHKRDIAHCDVTPSNLLIMPPDNPLSGVVKLIDFGLSRVIDRESAERQYGVVTVWYRAPELLIGDTGYTEKIDVWSAGCIFAELLNGSVLFRSQTKEIENDSRKFNRQQLTQIMDVIPLKPSDFAVHRCEHLRAFEELLRTVTSSRGSQLRARLGPVPPSALDLAEKMLAPNPLERISSSQALRHPYFNEAPLCVMNIAGEFSPEEWNELVRMGKNPSTES
jgi:cyclin-dependent kinase 8/11